MPRNTIVLPRRTLQLQTRQSNQIENWQERVQPRDGADLQIADMKRQYPDAIHRPVGPCSTYNCHGLTFGSRRTQIMDAEEIEHIIREDDYIRVELPDVMLGDIAVYYNNGDAEHSGIVVEFDQLDRPRILSKWGTAHEVIHKPSDCDYDPTDVLYYRICT